MGDGDRDDEQDLKALLEEVRSLRQDIDLLKANPVIGDAVSSALDFQHEQAHYDKSSYAVAVRPGPDLEELRARVSYNVLVAPDPDFKRVVDPVEASRVEEVVEKHIRGDIERG